MYQNLTIRVLMFMANTNFQRSFDDWLIHIIIQKQCQIKHEQKTKLSAL
jgi:hypothetical protein